MSYDQRCEELARYFLGGAAAVTEADVEALAREIQRTVEDWFAAR